MPPLALTVRLLMGTEILIIFAPISLLFFAWDMWQLRKPNRRIKSLALLGAGLIFMSYFSLSSYLNGFPFMQGFVIGSFFFAPFYLVSWIAITSILGFIAPKAENHEHID